MPGQALDDRQGHVPQEVIELCAPLLADEASADNERQGFLLIEVMRPAELLKFVPAAALQEALVDGGLHTSADVLDVRPARQLDLLPDLLLQRHVNKNTSRTP